MRDKILNCDMDQSAASKARLLEAETWVFDLDNTLYPASSDVFAQVDERMTRYISDFLDLTLEQAGELRQAYYLSHGTTMRGLMNHHPMEPGPFLEYVHDIDLGNVSPNPSLDRALSRLPGRKIIYTNGPADHAHRIMDRLSIGHHFEAVFDIISADYLPKLKPKAYENLVERFGLKPGKTVMVEDLARNLGPAAALGMITVWVRNAGDNPGDNQGPPPEVDVHHVVDDLVSWLSRLTAD